MFNFAESIQNRNGRKMRLTLVTLSLFLVLFASSCGNKSDKDYYKAGMENINDTSYSSAMENFQKLLKNYPESEMAAKASFEIGKLYHGKVIKNLSEKESLNKAIEYYKKTFNEYPESPPAPNALFMVAFIQANELNETESAKENYNEFLKNYPSNELAFSAQAELENLGVSPEEILKRRTAAEK